MRRRFHPLDPREFDELVREYSWTRQITAVHVHHTWRPTHADFRGERTIEGMWRFHTVELGWSDIAQHVTCDPEGILWPGREWNRAPASAPGFNGHSRSGPFMFEVVGDFDCARDVFGGPQRAALLEAIASILHFHGLGESAIRFHNEMSTKTCPGQTLIKPHFAGAVAEVLSHRLERHEGSQLYRSRYDESARIREIMREFGRSSALADDPEYAEPGACGQDISVLGTGEGTSQEALSTTEPSRLRPHGGNLCDGQDENNEGESHRKLALCIGIDEYKVAALSGCVNDAREWSRSLLRLGFEVDLLINEQATAREIVDRITSLIETASKGDVVVVQYAGHGTQFLDHDGDEVDHYDEALVSVDCDQGNFVLDDELREIFEKVAGDINVTCFLDCCHSGSATRVAPVGVYRSEASGDRRRRYFPPNAAMRASYRGQRSNMRRRSRSRGRSNSTHVAYAACLDDEYALEWKGQGEFTRRVAPLLESAFTDGVTVLEFQRRIDDAFRTFADQHPKVDSPGPMLDSQFLKPIRLVPIGPIADESGSGDDNETPASTPYDDRDSSELERLAQKLDAVADALRRVKP